MVGPPYWLTDKAVDELWGPTLDEFKITYDRFVSVIQHEEEAYQWSGTVKLSQMVREAWSTGRYWFVRALDCPDATCAIFDFNIDTRFGASYTESEQVLARLWDEDAAGFISEKVAQNAEYNDRVRELFAIAANASEKDR